MIEQAPRNKRRAILSKVAIFIAGAVVATMTGSFKGVLEEAGRAAVQKLRHVPPGPMAGPVVICNYVTVPNGYNAFQVRNISQKPLARVWLQEDVYLLAKGQKLYVGSGVPHFEYLSCCGQADSLFTLSVDETRPIRLASYQREAFRSLSRTLACTIVTRWIITSATDIESLYRYADEFYFRYDFDNDSFAPLEALPGGDNLLATLNARLATGQPEEIGISFLDGTLVPNPPCGEAVFRNGERRALHWDSQLTLAEVNALKEYRMLVRLRSLTQPLPGTVVLNWTLRDGRWDQLWKVEGTEVELPMLPTLPWELLTPHDQLLFAQDPSVLPWKTGTTANLAMGVLGSDGKQFILEMHYP